MIFQNESAIDSQLVSLSKKLKSSNLDFSIALDLKENIWIVTMHENWLNDGLAKVTYRKFHKNPFRIWWEIQKEDEKEILMTTELRNISQVVDSLFLLRYKNLGVQLEVVAWLAKEAIRNSLSNAIQRIAKETSFNLSLEEMKILGIEEQRGRITGRKFGL